MLTGVPRQDIEHIKISLADSLYRQIPAGLGSEGAITLEAAGMEGMLAGGARWAVEQGFGDTGDLERIEENGNVAGGQPEMLYSACNNVRQFMQSGKLKVLAQFLIR